MRSDLSKSSASTSYPSATADGTDCVQLWFCLLRRAQRLSEHRDSANTETQRTQRLSEHRDSANTETQRTQRLSEHRGSANTETAQRNQTFRASCLGHKRF